MRWKWVWHPWYDIKYSLNYFKNISVFFVFSQILVNSIVHCTVTCFSKWSGNLGRDGILITFWTGELLDPWAQQEFITPLKLQVLIFFLYTFQGCTQSQCLCTWICYQPHHNLEPHLESQHVANLPYFTKQVWKHKDGKENAALMAVTLKPQLEKVKKKRSSVLRTWDKGTEGH